MAAVRYDLPTIEGDSEPWWQGLRGGVLLLGRCDACSQVHFYPRQICPACWSDRVVLVPASGRGTIYTYSVVHVQDLPPFNAMVPFLAAVVELEEGPRLSTNITGVDFAAVSIGMPVTLALQEIAEGVFRPNFTPLH